MHGFRDGAFYCYWPCGPAGDFETTWVGGPWWWHAKAITYMVEISWQMANPFRPGQWLWIPTSFGCAKFWPSSCSKDLWRLLWFAASIALRHTRTALRSSQPWLHETIQNWCQAGPAGFWRWLTADGWKMLNDVKWCEMFMLTTYQSKIKSYSEIRNYGNPSTKFILNYEMYRNVSFAFRSFGRLHDSAENAQLN